MPQPPSAASRDEPVIRERGDACPGALRLHAADDGFLARIRIPGGLLDGPAALLLADAAERLGDGHLDLTSRGNAQLRGLGESCGGELAELLDRAGLLPAPSHERVRNVVASPLSGLDASGLPDVSGWVPLLDRLLCADPGAARLSGRFLFALDDGRGDVAPLAGDVTLTACGDGALVWTAGSPEGVLVAAGDAPRAALVAANLFLDAVARAGTRAWRVTELPAEHALDVRALSERLAAAGIPGRVAGVPAPRLDTGPGPGTPAPDAADGHRSCTPASRPADGHRPGTSAPDAADGHRPGTPAPDAADGSRSRTPRADAEAGPGTPASRPVDAEAGPSTPAPRTAAESRSHAHTPRAADGPAPGIVSGPGGAAALSVLAPLGRLTAAQWRLLAGLSGRMRLTPWRGVVVPGLTHRTAGPALDALAAAGLVTAPGDPRRSVTACTGRPGCAKSRADVRADARALAARTAGPLPVHWSGCERRCGHPRGTAWVDLVATPDGYEISAPGRPAAPAAHADLAAALTAARSTTPSPSL
ncbi:precorrin-3B synthase [Streptomyces sp. M-16]|uniref:precorrin-3B synthase n=1 Tax=Streptomyces sp. M-16 TaxID=3233040 RepID=UPI003F99957B